MIKKTKHLRDLQGFLEDLFSRLNASTDREYYLFTELWQKIEELKEGDKMLWLELTAWLNKEIEACETAKRDWNIDADKWEHRRKALEEVKKKINEKE